MKLKFDANQDFQLEAISAVADLFEGQRRQEMDVIFQLGGIPAVPNRLDLSEAELLANLQQVQKRNFDPENKDADYHGDPALLFIEETISTAEGEQTVRFPNFAVEMETGTGKTYVYIRTALELFRRYGMRKFIIVVPSVAIREGVIKTLEITKEHLGQLFDNTPYRFYAYDSKNLSQVRQFALAENVEFMVMTLAAFNKADSNIIHQSTDRLQGETPVHLVQAARPILILDEPQNMESELSIRSLAALNPLLALRYSATHRNPYNIVYRLSPAEAYKRRLVKRIEVAAAEQEGDTIQAYARLVSTKAEKRTLTARLAIHKQMANGQIRESVVAVKPGDSLVEKSGGRDVYQGYDIDEINDGMGFVRFANTRMVSEGQEIGGNKAEIFEAQIRYTIEQHLVKQTVYRPLGIKVLSLFFIDRVDNYAPEDGVIRQLFDRAFDDLKRQFPRWQELTADEVKAAYFAQKNTKAGVVLQDTKTGQSQQDREAFELIMRDKERLLSFEEPTAFIFSHSALREGWDNPNVFQICTLNQSVSEMRKRQEVGRGVRLAVDQTGARVEDERVNVLTVVANESYESFVQQLQSEIEADVLAEIEARFGKAINKLTTEERRRMEREYGTILPPAPTDARKRTKPRLRKEYMLKPEFKELWEQISRKTRYAVRVDSERLVKDVVAGLTNVHITAPRVAVTKAKVDINSEGAFEAWQMSAAKTLVSLAGRYPLPNLVDLMANLMEHTSPPMRLTRRTLLEIIKRAPEPQGTVDDPNEFAAEAVRIIKEKLSEQLIEGIQYQKVDDWYEQTLFEDEMLSWGDLVEPAQKALYDEVIWDSEVERTFVRDLEAREDVHLYIKLPNWFKVPTPIGNYNPDWAIVMDDVEEGSGRPMLYLVTETKGTTDESRLQWSHERKKIECGRRHFGELGVRYAVKKRAAELP